MTILGSYQRNVKVRNGETWSSGWLNCNWLHCWKRQAAVRENRGRPLQAHFKNENPRNSILWYTTKPCHHGSYAAGKANILLLECPLDIATLVIAAAQPIAFVLLSNYHYNWRCWKYRVWQSCVPVDAQLTHFGGSDFGVSFLYMAWTRFLRWAFFN